LFNFRFGKLNVSSVLWVQCIALYLESSLFLVACFFVFIVAFHCRRNVSEHAVADNDDTEAKQRLIRRKLSTNSDLSPSLNHTQGIVSFALVYWELRPTYCLYCQLWFVTVTQCSGTNAVCCV